MTAFDTDPSQTPRTGRPLAPEDTPRTRVGLTRGWCDNHAAARHDLYYLLIW